MKQNLLSLTIDIQSDMFMFAVFAILTIVLMVFVGYKLLQIMREMLTQPNLLIMDEPDAFLDFANLNTINKRKRKVLCYYDDKKTQT